MICLLKLQRNENPNAVITRTDLFLATHTRSDGSYPTQELSDATGKLREIIASDPASIRMDLNNDPVAQVFPSSSSLLHTQFFISFLLLIYMHHNS